MHKFPFFPQVILLLLGLAVTGSGCESSNPPPSPPPETPEVPASQFYRGADLSYVNEMLDCGAIYRDESSVEVDPYALFGQVGTDLVRVRLWHTPDWTDYSDLEDVQLTISRAKAAGMEVLLDFHYSDDWADPSKQKVPAAWLPVVQSTPELGDSVYQYTRNILTHLNTANLLPEYVQVGNEINSEILQDPNGTYDQINWERNAFLINRGIRAVRDVAAETQQEIQVMLHIAQPENALWWFEEAAANGISDYDWIGISYYPVWSDYTLESLPTAIEKLIETYQKRLMVVETAYPFALDNVDDANNILGESALLTDFPASEQGQYAYLQSLESAIEEGGGEGLIYWEPAWVSTTCSTQWGQGSHWDNATLIRRDGSPTKGMQYYSD